MNTLVRSVINEGTVGGLDTTTAETVAALTNTTAFTEDKVVEVCNISGTDAFFTTGATPATPSAVDGSEVGAYLGAYSTTRPFILRKGFKVKSTQKLHIRTLDV
jgi:hypothetical protein|tara:strand:+ start:652 stop:963 length:312 start_codon:yes stop_codon:yes gene_type:complete